MKSQIDLDQIHEAHMQRNDNFRIGVRTRTGDLEELVITIRPARDQRFAGGGFYATGGRYGCGKTSGTLFGAVNMLLQDMATMRWIQVEP